MLKIGAIGIGNAGSQVALVAHKEGIESMVLNSSEKDLAMVPDDMYKIPLGDLKGAGKNREGAKKFLQEVAGKIISSEKFINHVGDKDVVFIISSCGGGTGSGIVPVLTQILTKSFPDTKMILVGILPTLKEPYSTQTNTIEFTKELYGKLTNVTYMMYDNDKMKNIPSYKMMDSVNNEIVEDMKVLSCKYNIPTKYSSIDERDMLMILNTPGRIVLSRYIGFKDKDLDDKSIDKHLEDILKSNAHAELQRDKKIMRTGLIVNLSQNIIDKFDENLAELQLFVGEPVEGFTHTAVNSEKAMDNVVCFIGSGLSPITDRIQKITDRIAELDEATEESLDNVDDVLNELDLDEVKKKKNYVEKDVAKKIVLDDIFNDFM